MMMIKQRGEDDFTKLSLVCFLPFALCPECPFKATGVSSLEELVSSWVNDTGEPVFGQPPLWSAPGPAGVDVCVTRAAAAQLLTKSLVPGAGERHTCLVGWSPGDRTP